MPIKFMKPSDRSSGPDDDLIGELVSGVGRVPDYVDFGTAAIRTDDIDLANTLVEMFKGELEEHEGKRPYYVVFPEDLWLDIRATYLRTAMVLRSRNDGSVLRQCDGEQTKEGKDCVCIRDYEHGSPEWRAAAKENLACKPDGLLFFKIPGLDHHGKFIFSKGSESTVRAFIDLEGKLPPGVEGGFETAVHIKQVHSKKTGYTWSVPEFTDPVVADAAD